MVRANWVPESGDIVWLQFDPQLGHEQAGHRPALVLSPSSYNGKTGLMICCPVTTRVKGKNFEVPLAGEPASVVLADHVKNLDWRARSAKPKGKATQVEVNQVKGRIKALLAI
jgi:mRNA interferase MazF